MDAILLAPMSMDNYRLLVISHTLIGARTKLPVVQALSPWQLSRDGLCTSIIDNAWHNSTAKTLFGQSGQIHTFCDALEPLIFSGK